MGSSIKFNYVCVNHMKNIKIKIKNKKIGEKKRRIKSYCLQTGR